MAFPSGGFNSQCSTPDAQRLSPNAPPRHVAIIMDGNGRWARARGLDRLEGHWEGYRTLKTIVYAADELGIRYLTVCSASPQKTGGAPRTKSAG